jgi:hypothetical protein
MTPGVPWISIMPMERTPTPRGLLVWPTMPAGEPDSAVARA